MLGPIPEFYHELCATAPLKCPKGVANRLAGLDWVYNHAKNNGDMSGAIYFADDDNTYDIRLFEEVHDNALYIFLKAMFFEIFSSEGNP